MFQKFLSIHLVLTLMSIQMLMFTSNAHAYAAYHQSICIGLPGKGPATDWSRFDSIVRKAQSSASSVEKTAITVVIMDDSFDAFNDGIVAVQTLAAKIQSTNGGLRLWPMDIQFVQRASIECGKVGEISVEIVVLLSESRKSNGFAEDGVLPPSK